MKKIVIATACLIFSFSVFADISNCRSYMNFTGNIFSVPSAQILRCRYIGGTFYSGNRDNPCTCGEPNFTPTDYPEFHAWREDGGNFHPEEEEKNNSEVSYNNCWEERVRLQSPDDEFVSPETPLTMERVRHIKRCIALALELSGWDSFWGWVFRSNFEVENYLPEEPYTTDEDMISNQNCTRYGS